MRIDAFLTALRDLPVTKPDRLTGGEPFVVLSPHPDDESLGAGGLIAWACDAGTPPDVVVVTDGAKSHPHSTSYPADRLIAVRKAETAAAAAALGLAANRLLHLGLPDAQAPMRGPAFEQALDRVEHVVSASRAASLFVTWRHDPHCDHEAADEMARALRIRVPGLKLWSYPIWGWHRAAHEEVEAPPPQGFRIDVGPWQVRKRAAIAAHASQMTDLINDDPEGFRFHERTLAPFLGPFETFFEVPA